MRDIPIFSTELGVASLTLSQIPYSGKAYIRIQDTAQPESFIDECAGFCRAAGAETIYITGHSICEKYKEYTSVIEMQCLKSTLGQTDAALFPATDETLSGWRQIYNDKIVKVPNGAWLTISDAQMYLKDRGLYFVHRGGKLLGTGIVYGNELQWVCAVVPGGGADVVRALCSCVTDDTVKLTVASSNEKAAVLYRKLGFIPTNIHSTWYEL